MRIWFIHPQYYDKKGLLAQWNEALILRNVIYGSRNQITVEKLKAKSVKKNSKKHSDNESDEEKPKSKSRTKSYSKISRSQKVATTEIPKGYGWINHPFSKRVTRYNKDLQKKIINTYLNHIRTYGVKHFGINFNDKYLDPDNIDNSLRIPILYEHIRKDEEDALFKMETRDPNILDFVKTVKKVEDFKLNRPFYYEVDLKKYLDSLSEEYFEWSEKDLNKLIGTEIEFSSDQYDSIKKKYKFDTLIKTYKQKKFKESDFIDKTLDLDEESDDEKSNYFKLNDLEEIGLAKKASKSKSKSKSKVKDNKSSKNLDSIVKSSKKSLVVEETDDDVVKVIRKTRSRSKKK